MKGGFGGRWPAGSPEAFRRLASRALQTGPQNT
jgi:hypothetical protein